MKKLKIMSFNVREWSRDTKKSSPYYWKDRMDAMKKMLIEESPDIICFQEMSFPACTYVPDEYKRVGLMINHPIYIKKGLSAKNKSWGIHYSKATIDGIRIINVHSHWNKKILANTLEDINKEFSNANNFPAIACGDFNNYAWEISECSITNFGHDMICAREYLKMKMEDTFQNFTKETSHGEIDFFFSTNNSSFSDFKIIKNGYGVEKISDHYPIVINFERK